jgi:predicted CopG family antitoxin
MAVKTITIDMEAYDTLSRHKKAGQSFSQVIKAHFGPLKSVASFRRALQATAVSEHTLDAVDDVIRTRKRSTARVPTL